MTRAPPFRHHGEIEIHPRNILILCAKLADCLTRGEYTVSNAAAQIKLHHYLSTTNDNDEIGDLLPDP